MNVSDSDIFGDWNVAHRNVHLQWFVAELDAPAWLVAVPMRGYLLADGALWLVPGHLVWLILAGSKVRLWPGRHLPPGGLTFSPLPVGAFAGRH